MKGKMIAISSVLLVFALCSNTDIYALELTQAKWLHQAVNDEGNRLNQDTVGENAINVFIVSDTHLSWDELHDFAMAESDYFLNVVPYRHVYNIVVIQVDDLGFFIKEKNGHRISRPLRTVRPVVTSLTKREYGKNDFLVYVNGFDRVNDAISHGYTETTVSDGMDWFYATVSTRSAVVGGIAHELGHLIANLADEYFALGTGRSFQLEYLNENNGVVREVNLFGDTSYTPTADIVEGELENVHIIDIPKHQLSWAPLIKDDVPLPTWQVPAISFGEFTLWSGEFFRKNFPYADSIGAFGDALFAPTDGACIMNAPDDRWGYCSVCEHAWTVQALTRTREINVQHQEEDIVLHQSAGLSPATASSFAVSWLDTYDTRSAYWLIDGVTIENRFNQTSWSDSELRDLIGKSLTLRIINETAEELLVYNPYSNPHSDIGGLGKIHVQVDLPRVYTEEYTWHIKEFVPPTATPVQPTHTPSPTTTPVSTITPVSVVTIKPNLAAIPANITTSLNGNILTLGWEWNTDDPMNFTIHLWGNNSFVDSKQSPGEERTVTFTLDQDGEYQGFVRAEFVDGSFTEWAYSEVVQYIEPTTPTPTVTPTLINTATPVPPTNTPVPNTPTPQVNTRTMELNWDQIPYFGAGITLAENEVSEGSIVVDNEMLRVSANNGEVATFLPLNTSFTAIDEVTFSVHVKTDSIGWILHVALIEVDCNDQYTGSLNPVQYSINNPKDKTFTASFTINEGHGVVPLIQVAAGSQEVEVEFSNPTLLFSW